jgi:hypothetical protein
MSREKQTKFLAEKLLSESVNGNLTIECILKVFNDLEIGELKRHNKSLQWVINNSYPINEWDFAEVSAAKRQLEINEKEIIRLSTV